MSRQFGSLNQSTFKVLAILKHGWDETRGQDLIEYALMAGLVVVTAGAISPTIATNISIIFSKVTSNLAAANAQGS